MADVYQFYGGLLFAGGAKWQENYFSKCIEVVEVALRHLIGARCILARASCNGKILRLFPKCRMTASSAGYCCALTVDMAARLHRILQLVRRLAAFE